MPKHDEAGIALQSESTAFPIRKKPIGMSG